MIQGLHENNFYNRHCKLFVPFMMFLLAIYQFSGSLSLSRMLPLGHAGAPKAILTGLLLLSLRSEFCLHRTPEEI